MHDDRTESQRMRDLGEYLRRVYGSPVSKAEWVIMAILAAVAIVIGSVTIALWGCSTERPPVVETKPSIQTAPQPVIETAPECKTCR